VPILQMLCRFAQSLHLLGLCIYNVLGIVCFGAEMIVVARLTFHHAGYIINYF